MYLTVVSVGVYVCASVIYACGSGVLVGLCLCISEDL